MARPSPRDHLHKVLVAADPLRNVDAGDLVSPAAFDELVEQIVADNITDLVEAPTARSHARGNRRARRRGRKFTAGMVAAGVIFAGVGTAAATNVLPLHTGFFGQPGDTEDTSGHEFLNAGAPGFKQVTQSAAKGVPFPPGVTAAGFPGFTNGLAQTTGATLAIELDAQCAWSGYWLQARSDGNSVAQAQATAFLQIVPTLRIVKQTDRGGTVGFDKLIAAGAAANDPTYVAEYYRANCVNRDGTPEAGLPATYPTAVALPAKADR